VRSREETRKREKKSSVNLKEREKELSKPVDSANGIMQKEHSTQQGKNAHLTRLLQRFTRAHGAQHIT
jgi:hypothetical protein